MIVTRQSAWSGAFNKMDLGVTPAQISRWRSGELVQNVFPHLTPEEREFLITGMVPGEQDEMYHLIDRIAEVSE